MYCVHWTAGKIAEHYSRTVNTSVWAKPVELHAAIVLDQQSGYMIHFVYLAILVTVSNYSARS